MFYEDISMEFLHAVWEGDSYKVRELVEKYGLSFAEACSGYKLLVEALKNDKEDVACLLLELGAKVEDSSEPADTPLHYSAYGGYTDIVKILLSKGAGIEFPNKQGETPLHRAVEGNNLEAIKLLVNHGASVNARKTNTGITPLHTALRRRDVEVAEYLISCGGDVNTSAIWIFDIQWTPLHFAAFVGSEEIAKLLLDNNATVNAKSKGMMEPIHFASNEGHVNIVNLLMEHGADVNVCDYKGENPLHFAVKKGNTDIVAALLKNGIDVNAGDKYNDFIPILKAAELKHESIVALLLEHGANVDALDKLGRTVLYFAVENNHSLSNINLILSYLPDVTIDGNRWALSAAANLDDKEIVDILLKYGFSSRLEDFTDLKLFHTAIRNGHMNLTKELLNNCQDVKAFLNEKTGDQGLLPLQVSCKHKQIDMVKELIKYGADVNAKSKGDPRPAIFFSVESEDFDITKLLLSHGADVKTCPKPLFMSIEKCCPELVEMLLQAGADVNSCDEKLGSMGMMTPLQFAVDPCVDRVMKLVRHLNPGMFSKNLNTNKHDSPVAREKIVQLILQYGANVNAPDEKGKTPICQSIDLRDLKVTNILLESNASVKGYPDLLPKAVAMQNKPLIENLLKVGADLNGRDEVGTALHRTVSLSNQDSTTVDIAELLLKAGADVNAKNTKDKTPLIAAIEQGYEKVVNVLLEYGADVNLQHVVDGHLLTPLFLSLLKDREDIVEMLLNKGVQVNAVLMKNNRLTALHIVASAGLEKTANVLVKRPDIQIDCMDVSGDTPLHHAAQNSKVATIVEILLQGGADVNCKGNKGKTPLHYAVTKGNRDTISTLLKFGAMLGSTDKYMRTPLHYAAQRGSIAKIVALLEHCVAADTGNASLNTTLRQSNLKTFSGLGKHVINDKDILGQTPLHLAVKRNRKGCVQVLLDHGADINCQDKGGNTPLHYSVEVGKMNNGKYDAVITSVLLDRDAEVDITNNMGETALHKACCATTYPNGSVSYLLEHGADVNIYAGEFKDQTPFGYAKKQGHQHSKTRDIFESHLVKLNIANEFSVNRANLELINVMSWDEFESECVNELVLLKEKKLDESNLSLYDVLTRKRNQMSRFLRDKSLSDIFASDDYTSDLPLYGRLIRPRLRMLIKRCRLLNDANAFFAVALPILPDLCFDAITDYLSNDDLKRLVQACQLTEVL